MLPHPYCILATPDLQSGAANTSRREGTNEVVRGIVQQVGQITLWAENREEKKNVLCACHLLVQGSLFSMFLCKFFSILQEFFTVLWIFFCQVCSQRMFWLRIIHQCNEGLNYWKRNKAKEIKFKTNTKQLKDDMCYYCLLFAKVLTKNNKKNK